MENLIQYLMVSGFLVAAITLSHFRLPSWRTALILAMMWSI